MRIHRLAIRRFRGIKRLEWDVGGQFVCLVGPGDSAKSTVLDAIEIALCPRWNVAFDDSDFFDADSSAPIEITITVGNVPEQLKSDAKFGLEMRGWTDANGLNDEPDDTDELVLSIQLKVDSSLEPKWNVVNDRNPDGRPISAQDRELFGVARIGTFLDRHLSWGRGSVLSRLTGKGGEVSEILALVSRAARQTVTPESLPVLQSAADRATTLGKPLGVGPKQKYQPHLDMQAVSVGIGGLSLHDGQIPVRRAGLGTRRLLTIALQKDAVKEGGITLIDEVEQGLEPHRLRRLLRVLRQPSAETEGPDTKDSVLGQVVMTTHSDVAIDELSASELRIVRAHNGEIQVLPIVAELQKVIRKVPEAFLGKKLLVCEGKTEVGFCRALDSWWSQVEGRDALAYLGVVPIDGDGTTASGTAVKLAGLGYQTAYFGDSDRTLNPDEMTMKAAGIHVLVWDGKMSTEVRIAADLPWKGIQQMVSLASEAKGEASVRDAIKSRCRARASELDGMSARG